MVAHAIFFILQKMKILMIYCIIDIAVKIWDSSFVNINNLSDKVFLLLATWKYVYHDVSPSLFSFYYCTVFM